MYVGVLVSLIRLGFPMVFVRVVFSLLFFLLCIWMVSEFVECVVVCYWKNLLAGCLCYADDNYCFTCIVSICAKNYVEHLL